MLPSWSSAMDKIRLPEIELGLDVAASEFKVERDGESVYDLNFKGREEQLMSGDDMVNYYNKLIFLRYLYLS